MSLDHPDAPRSARWATLERLYHEALTLDVGSRKAFLIAGCAGDAALLAEVESLLAHDGGAAFLETPAPMVDVPSGLSPGTIIGSYEVVGSIGEGGMGDVYEAVHETLGRRHALKVLARRAHERDRAYVERFVREAQAVARLCHPHIVGIYDFGYLADRRPYLVMELLGGVSLGDVLLGGALPPAQALSMATQLAEALAAAHARGVIHGDVTPSNVLVDDGHITLIDFGLAQLREAQLQTEPADEVYGTPSYIAPEQVRGYGATDATDQYAFGIVVHELLTGSVPFTGPTTRDTCMAHLEAPVPPLTSPYGHVSPRLAAIIARCLAKSPSERWGSMAAVAAQLARLAEVTS